MMRGEIWWVSFDPAIGGEITKTRPAIIVSNNSSNRHMNRVQVIPLTTKIGKLYPCECLIDIDGRKVKAMADQIATVSKARLKNKLAVADACNMADIERIVKVQLGIRQ